MCESATYQRNFPALFAAEEVIGGTRAVLLEQPVTNTLLRLVSSQARGLGFVKDFDSIVDFIDDSEF